jgi:hypothetical protein
MSRHARLLALGFVTVLNGCAPPPELTAAEEEIVRQCLELAYKQETSSECGERVTKPMEKAFLQKHPEFYDRLLADRKSFVEERIAADRRRSDELSLCVADHEAGRTDSPACEKFMPHEIKRATEDRHLRRCAEARLDGTADAERRCEGLPDHIIAEEVQAERTRRERRR